MRSEGTCAEDVIRTCLQADRNGVGDIEVFRWEELDRMILPSLERVVSTTDNNSRSPGSRVRVSVRKARQPLFSCQISAAEIRRSVASDLAHTDGDSRTSMGASNTTEKGKQKG
ncbi:hypothetical protein EVAR_60388_1 [Eumeta japonica]|uniref:Uncharacterized protein n=1 Tax=Eumeta variegata TaxID=151549 RepID=A0A4C2A4Q7_EUMVA|nr:hypothetical protein EVAR_60388_1 [Eumeta japonica]